MSLQAIKQVKDAEAEAGKMVQDAQAESRRLIAGAQREGREKVDRAVDEAEKEVKSLMLQAERDAADERVKILERSETECAVLRAAARGRLDQAAKFIVERIVSA